MSDFDITSVHSKNSFVASLKRRKAFGLVDSDSEDEDLSKRKARNTSAKSLSKKKLKDEEETVATNSIPPSPLNITNENSNDTQTADQSVEQQSTENPYLVQNPELELLKQQLNAPRRPPSFMSNSSSTSHASEEDIKLDTSLVDDDDILDLDPEIKAMLQQSTSEVEPQKIVIKLQYAHNFKQLSENAQKVIERLMKPIKIIVMDNTQFRVILENFCKKKKLKRDDCVLVYKEDLVFLSATPGGIGMDTIGTNQMKVYPRTCYESLIKEKEEKKLERLRKLEKTADEELDYDSVKLEFSYQEKAKENEEDSERKIRLQLRDKDDNCFPVTIAPSKKLEALINFYKSQTGTTANVQLSLDGEVMNSFMTIEETDLEDEDMVDVVQA